MSLFVALHHSFYEVSRTIEKELNVISKFVDKHILISYILLSTFKTAEKFFATLFFTTHFSPLFLLCI